MGGLALETMPFRKGFQYGVTWTEDILFVEPETVCIDTNLTLNHIATVAHVAHIGHD